MNITAITSALQAPAALSSQLGVTRGSSATSAMGSGPSFGSTIRGVIDSLDRQQVGAEQEIARAVAGESPDMHRTIASLQAADLSFQLALQVRNKLIGAYEEIMRMPV
jgi:flagellar hook-basal body complex protein FliE